MAATREPAVSVEDLLSRWAEEGIRNVRFELPDMHGTSRSKLVPIEHAARYSDEGLNMYGGTVVLDSRSDVVSGTLYNEEVGYGDQRLKPDPSTAAVIPWAPGTARLICDTFWDDGSPLRAAPRHVFRQRTRALSRARLRATDRHRARVLSARRGDQRAAVRRLPHLQHGPQHVDAGGRADRQRVQRIWDRHHHCQQRVRGVTVGDRVRPEQRHGRSRHCVQLQDRRQGARQAGGPDRKLHVQAV